MFSRLFALRRMQTSAATLKKAVFITGCDSGFGYSLCRHLIEKGNKDYVVIAGCYVNKEGVKDLKRRDDGLYVVRIDLTDQKSIEEACKEVKNILTKNNAELYCLINNAATLIFADAILQTYDQIMHQYKVNVIGPLSLTRSLAPELIEAKGRVVNMISFCSTCPYPTLSVYTATKASLMRLSEGMRTELTRFGVDVVLFNPGDNPNDTPLCAGQMGHYKAMEDGVNDLFKDNPEVQEYFKAIKAKFSQQFPMPEIQKIDNPGFYTEVYKILRAERPYSLYINSDLITRSFYWVVNNLPSWMGDQIRIKIMRLPPF